MPTEVLEKKTNSTKPNPYIGHFGDHSYSAYEAIKADYARELINKIHINNWEFSSVDSKENSKNEKKFSIQLKDNFLEIVCTTGPESPAYSYVAFVKNNGFEKIIRGDEAAEIFTDMLRMRLLNKRDPSLF
jgi:hypothetical protein